MADSTTDRTDHNDENPPKAPAGLGIGTEPKDTEAVRAKLKRLVQ
jgi:hypothetical protein